MGDVDIGHDKRVAPDTGDTFAAGLGTPVYSGTFTYVHIVADFYIGHFPVEFQVLRDGPHYRPREYAAVLSHFDIVEYGRMRKDMAAVPDFNELVDESVRADLDVIPYFRIRMDCCKWMYLIHGEKIFISLNS